MRHLLIAVAVLGLLSGTGTPAHTQTSAVGCEAVQGVLAARAVVYSRALPYFVEVDLTVRNTGAQPVRIDPTRFVLVPDAAPPVAAADRAAVIQALQRPSATSISIFGFFGTNGSVGIGIGLGPIEIPSRAIEARLFPPTTLSGGAAIRGSVYFRPAAWPAQFSLILNDLTNAAGVALPPLELRHCTLPVQPEGAPEPMAPPQAARTIAMSVRTETGPLTVAVSRVELTRQATTLTVTVENTAAAEASLFVAIGQAHLVDSSGQTYAVRMLRSDLPDRVGPQSRVHGRLVFEPIPPASAERVVACVMPGVRVGDDVYDLRVDLRF
jgi:hypothetical protein